MRKRPKTKTFQKYFLEYVTVRNVPMVETEQGYVMEADVLGRVERAISRVIVAGKIPLRGKEIQFIRKSLGLSARGFGEMLGISHVAVRKWEKNFGKRLEPLNEIAVRAILAAYIEIDMYIRDAILTEKDKPKKIIIDAKKVA